MPSHFQSHTLKSTDCRDNGLTFSTTSVFIGRPTTTSRWILCAAALPETDPLAQDRVDGDASRKFVQSPQSPSFTLTCKAPLQSPHTAEFRGFDFCATTSAKRCTSGPS